jgi:hypothetical protein
MESESPHHHYRWDGGNDARGADIESSFDGTGVNNFLERNVSDLSELREPLVRKRTLNTTSQIAIVGANVCPIESLDYE